MKKKSTLDKIIYYHLTTYLILAITILLTHIWISNSICLILNITTKKSLQNLIHLAVPLGSYGTLIYIFYNTARSRKYHLLTGRSYGYDHSHYDRSYASLVRYFSEAEPHKMDTSVFPSGNWRDVHGLIFGKAINHIISIPSSSECNIAIFGPPGSGKTSGIAIPSAMQFAGSVLAIDIKGDIYHFVHKNSNRKIIRFCPDHPDALKISAHFDPIAGFNTMSVTDQKLYLENMALVLIPDEGGNEGNFFSTRARKIFQGIAHLMLHKNPDTSFPDIVHAILTGNIFDWVREAIAGDCETAKELLASFYGSNEKNVSGAYDALTTALVHFSSPILDVLLSKGPDCISICDLDAGYDIYLQISQDHLDTYAPLFTLIIQNFSTAFSRRPDSSTGVKNRSILMLLDEFPQMTYAYKQINSNLSTLRSKSIILMLIQQNLSQLEYRYGPAGTRSIVGNCNYQVILGSNDIQSSESFSKLFGTKKILKISNSITKSTQDTSGKSVQETEIRVYPPEYFGDLSANDSMILYAKGKYAEVKKINCYRD